MVGPRRGIIGYDPLHPRTHLSEQVDRWLVTHLLLTWTVGGIVAAHTMNLIPKPELLDPGST